MPKLIDNLLRVPRIAKPGSGLAPSGADNRVSDVGYDFANKAARD